MLTIALKEEYNSETGQDNPTYQHEQCRQVSQDGCLLSDVTSAGSGQPGCPVASHQYDRPFLCQTVITWFSRLLFSLHTLGKTTFGEHSYAG